MIPTHGSKSALMMEVSLRYQFHHSVIPSHLVKPVDVVHYEDTLAAFNEDTE